MLGDSETRAGHHERRGRGDVERAGGITAGAAGVDQHLAVGAAEPGHVVAACTDADDLLAHHLREADQLLDGFALHAQRREERADLRAGRGTRHDGFHGRRRLDAREVAPVHQRTERLGDDRARHGVGPPTRIVVGATPASLTCSRHGGGPT